MSKTKFKKGDHIIDRLGIKGTVVTEKWQCCGTNAYKIMTEFGYLTIRKEHEITFLKETKRG